MTGVKGLTNSAFTMIEIMIVIAISILLAGIAIPIMTCTRSHEQLSAECCGCRCLRGNIRHPLPSDNARLSV